MPGDSDVDDHQPPTQYATPVAEATGPPPRASTRPLPTSDAPPSRGTRIEQGEEAPRRSRGLLFVVLCFVLGASLAAGWAWKMGKLGGGDVDDERYVTRATDAMYKHRFVAPAGDNVRDITDEGLKKWPNDHRLLDIRMRSANELVTQATVQRSAGDIVEALRLARAAHELDPNDASAKRLVNQYDAELATFTTPTATPLVKPPPSLAATNGKPVAPAAVPSASSSSAASSFKVLLEANVGAPRVGQTVEFTARVAPTKGAFEGASFAINGPGLGGGATMPAQSPSPGVFKASFAFLEPGRFDVTFTAQADGKPLKAGRSLTAGAPPAPKPPDPAKPPPPPATAPTGSVEMDVKRTLFAGVLLATVASHLASSAIAHAEEPMGMPDALPPPAPPPPSEVVPAPAAPAKPTAEARAASRAEADAASRGRRALAHHRPTSHRRRARSGHHRAAERAHLGGAERR